MTGKTEAWRRTESGDTYGMSEKNSLSDTTEAGVDRTWPSRREREPKLDNYQMVPDIKIRKPSGEDLRKPGSYVMRRSLHEAKVGKSDEIDSGGGNFRTKRGDFPIVEEPDVSQQG